MPHLSHTSLMSPLVNPFVSSNILNFLQDEMKADKTCTLRPFQIYDPSDPITALSVPTAEIARNNEQSPSTQVTVLFRSTSVRRSFVNRYFFIELLTFVCEFARILDGCVYLCAYVPASVRVSVWLVCACVRLCMSVL
ncbi:unnamed protein product [Toxocara canis]|uniref:DET1- and DDB1-associated protein 1 n=1 Tax=Toxocara canis TaxID=6265 RepID=A0A183U8T0_TOXCA|nr:unnamed protein product [Toxocara canis]